MHHGPHIDGEPYQEKHSATRKTWGVTMIPGSFFDTVKNIHTASRVTGGDARCSGEICADVKRPPR